MHIPDGFLTPPVWGTLDAISAAVVPWVARRAQRDTQDQRIPLLGVMGAFVFAAFSLFMGYLLPSENVMQLISPVLGIFALFGGMFIPLSIMPSEIQDIAPYMPTYGVAAIARFPLLGGAFDWSWVLSVAFWTAVFAIAAMTLFRRDTRRT